MEADIDERDHKVLTVTTRGKNSVDCSPVSFHLVDRLLAVEGLDMVAEQAALTCCSMYAGQIFRRYI